jgi:hypothetical protein
MYESVVTTVLIIMCAVFIAFISYSFGRTIRIHEEKLSELSDDISRHERDIARIDDTLMEHIRDSNAGSKKATLNRIKKIFTI